MRKQEFFREVRRYNNANDDYKGLGPENCVTAFICKNKT